MKKTKILMLSMLLVGLSACGKTEVKEAEPKDTVVEETGETMDVEVVEDKVVGEGAEEAPLEAEMEPPMLEMEEKVEEKDVLSFLTEFPIKTDSYLSCVKSNVQFCQSDAVNQQNRKEKNDTACSYLGTESSQNDCRNQLWNVLAQEEGDAALCDKIKDEYQVKACKNSAYQALSTKNKDVKFCEKIDDEFMKSGCVNSFAYQQAFEQLDDSFCENITGEFAETEQESCVASVKMEKEMQKSMSSLTEESIVPLENPEEAALENPVDASADVDAERNELPVDPVDENLTAE